MSFVIATQVGLCVLFCAPFYLYILLLYLYTISYISQKTTTTNINGFCWRKKNWNVTRSHHHRTYDTTTKIHQSFDRPTHIIDGLTLAPTLHTHTCYYVVALGSQLWFRCGMFLKIFDSARWWWWWWWAEEPQSDNRIFKLLYIRCAHVAAVNAQYFWLVFWIFLRAFILRLAIRRFFQIYFSKIKFSAQVC